MKRVIRCQLTVGKSSACRRLLSFLRVCDTNFHAPPFSYPLFHFSLQIAAHLVLDVSIAWPARNSCHHLRAGPARAAAYCPHTVSPNQPRPWLSHTQIARRLLCRRTAGARTWSNFYSVSCSLSGFGQVSRRSRTRRRFQQFNHASTFATARCRRFHRRFKFNGIRLHGSK